MNEDKRADGKGIFVQKKTGYIILPERDTIEPYHVELGGGSAYGGRYKPAKPEDERFVGKPGEIKITYAKDGSKIETHIGPNGLADKEQHHNGRPNPHTHSNPHDHEINFEGPIANKPNFGPPINYWDGVPEFVGKSGGNMGTLVQTNSFEDDRFKTISDFKWSMKCGGEATFEWNGVLYGTYRDGEKYCICLITGENEQCFESPDDLLEFVIGEDRLRDVITKVTVWSRNT